MKESLQQDQLINQFLSLEIDKQNSKVRSPGRETNSADDAKTDVEQELGDESPNNSKQVIRSQHTYDLSINSVSNPPLSSGVISSPSSKASQQYQAVDFNNNQDDILSFSSSSNNILMSGIGTKIFYPSSDLRQKSNLQESDQNSLNQFDYSMNSNYSYDNSIDGMLSSTDSYNPQSKMLDLSYHPSAGGSQHNMMNRNYPNQAPRHHVQGGGGGGHGYYPNPEQQYQPRQPYRRNNYQQPLQQHAPNYHHQNAPSGRGYFRGDSRGGNQRQAHNHNPSAYGYAAPDPMYGSESYTPPPPPLSGPYNNSHNSNQYLPSSDNMYLPQEPPQSYARSGGAGTGGNNFRGPAVTRPNLEQNLKPDEVIYQVQFKRTIRYFTWPFNIMQIQVQIGDFVIVQADRGEDLGIVTDTLTTQAFMDRRYQMKAYMDEEDQTIGCILRVANPSERKLLTENFHDERLILKSCRELVTQTYGLPMEVIDVEYQFDRNKITIYYDSHLRIDFRELVRDLFSSYKARIWMKKINQFHAPDLKAAASAALATGIFNSSIDMLTNSKS